MTQEPRTVSMSDPNLAAETEPLQPPAAAPRSDAVEVHTEGFPAAPEKGGPGFAAPHTHSHPSLYGRSKSAHCPTCAIQLESPKRQPLAQPSGKDERPLESPQRVSPFQSYPHPGRGADIEPQVPENESEGQ